MAATTSGALKALIEAASLSLSAYRDEAPDQATLPYCIIHEGISLVPDASNARYDNAGTKQQAVEQVQVSLWQQWRDSTGALIESYTLPDALEEVLDGAQLPSTGSGAPPKHVWGVRFLSYRRDLDRENNKVHHPFTVEIVRDV